jgi:hypothetical protein
MSLNMHNVIKYTFYLEASVYTKDPDKISCTLRLWSISQAEISQMVEMRPSERLRWKFDSIHLGSQLFL